MMTELSTSTIDRPPIATADITADLILETAERLGIGLTRWFPHYARDRQGSGMRRGTVTGVAAIALAPSLADTEIIRWQQIVDAGMTRALAMGLYFGSRGTMPEPVLGLDCLDPDFLRSYAVGREVARRAGLEGDQADRN